MQTLGLILLHFGALYGIYSAVKSGKWQTIVFGYILGVFSAIGTLMGAHRYYTHRSFKAKWPLRLILCVMQTLTGQKSIVNWVREHRTHHQFTGTDADCVNIERGFFFAHMGWLMTETHPECERRMKECNVDDLRTDPMIGFQYTHYCTLYALINVIIPTILPYYLWGETIENGFFGAFMLRYVYTLHVSFCGNSVVHMWGTKPYDKTISATRNESIIFATLGGAYHNYHHVFPFDYSASEFGFESNFNFMTAVIDLCATIGWAYDLKRAPIDMVLKRKQRTGDHSDLEDNSRPNPLLHWIYGLILSASTNEIMSSDDTSSDPDYNSVYRAGVGQSGRPLGPQGIGRGLF
ncbi:unnamed protein product, partial [Medioppia subpectinata]